MLNYLSSASQGRSPIGVSFPPLSVKHIVSYQFSSVAKSRPTLGDPMDCSRPGFLVITNSWRLLKLMSIESVIPSNHLILCHPLLLLPSILPSIRVFSNESALSIRWPSGNFSFSISPSNEYSGLIPFRIDWFDLAVQGTLKCPAALEFGNIDSLVLSLLYSDYYNRSEILSSITLWSSLIHGVVAQGTNLFIWESY